MQINCWIEREVNTWCLYVQSTSTGFFKVFRSRYPNVLSLDDVYECEYLYSESMAILRFRFPPCQRGRLCNWYSRKWLYYALERVGTLVQWFRPEIYGGAWGLRRLV